MRSSKFIDEQIAFALRRLKQLEEENRQQNWTSFWGKGHCGKMEK